MNIKYVLKEGFKSFKRAKLASFTSIFSLFIAILLLGVLGRITYNAYEVGQSLQQSIDVEVFLEDVNERTKDDLEQKFSEQELINSISFISKDSAATIFEQEFGMGGSSLAELQFLPASFRLDMNSNTNIKTVDSLVAAIGNYRGVDEVRFNQQLLQLLEKRFKTVTSVGIGFGVLTLLAALVLVFNTIRLTIYAKRGLIKAMKLVGATNSFIRRPFVIEGVIQGVIAGLLAVGITYVSFQHLLPAYVPQFGILEWPFGRWYYLCGAMVLLAIFMGFWGSQWAARRFIKKTSIAE